MIPPTYKPKKKFMQLAIAEAKRARDRGDYLIGAVITRLIGRREVVIASAGNRVKTSGSSIKHVELETLKYVSSGYGRICRISCCIPRTNLAPCVPVPASGPK
jgi:tRNA(Arg) A34 adenosine deaminase TadA